MGTVVIGHDEHPGWKGQNETDGRIGYTRCLNGLGLYAILGQSSKDILLTINFDTSGY